MILIAESGSTKTDWRLVKTDKVLSFSTIGFNPYHISATAIRTELQQSELKEVASQVTQLYFYGAGCSSPEKKELIRAALAQFFTQAKIEVNHDLLAAARAACGTSEGMTAILGTGSNSCLFDGETITANIPALGYILGDQGSGVHLGKTLMQMVLGKELPATLIEQFKTAYNYELGDILNAVYKEPLPNRFLAQFTKFIKAHEQHPEMEALIKGCFEQFFAKTICNYANYQSYKLNVVGSIGVVFEKQLRDVAKSNGVELGKIIQSPVEELLRFHTSQ